MPERFCITGGQKLDGEVTVSGAKNSALNLIAAALLSPEKSRLDNVPRITDFLRMTELASSIGASVAWTDDHTLEIHAPSLAAQNLDMDIVGSLRASIVLAAPLAIRCRTFRVSHPGGCQIGARTVEPHLEVIRKFGGIVSTSGEHYEIDAGNLHPADFFLSEMSVTATEIAVMIASVLPGASTIRGVAIEPHVQDLCRMLCAMGASIDGIGSHTLVVEGTTSLRGVNHRIIPDPIEAGTFLIAAILTRGSVRIRDIVPDHIGCELEKCREAGATIALERERPAEHGYTRADIVVRPATKFHALRKIHNMPFPGLSPDLIPLFALFMTQAEGSTVVHDWMYEGRLKYVDELMKMGAHALVMDPHRVLVTGPTPLYGRDITSLDIRAGATLVLAGLIAEGATVINDIGKIDRGYERLEDRLRALGADIRRESIELAKS
ncbi:MAG: UDP-N-acetylglucosamine 1-carboxyvinyltransferase [Parcubacteria group bacterium]|nr:UDP-N-acetylglucosamine 1-carboxyvinyltransferase [Parcubacteria group bacterium]